MKRILACALLSAVTISSAEAALVDRGGGMIYDTDLNVTWLKNANQGAGSSFDDGFDTADGRMTWDNAKAWAESLVFGGFDDWRLPTVGPIGSAFNYGFSNNGTTDRGYGNTSPNSELAYMYYVNLGNLGQCNPNDPECDDGDQPGFGLENTGPFTSLQSGVYWTGTVGTGSGSAADLTAWYFGAMNGSQSQEFKTNEYYAWAVRDGDVGAVAPPVPLPAAAWLLLSGLGGLGLLGRRRAGRTG
jgi:hypothetical protein